MIGNPLFWQWSGRRGANLRWIVAPLRRQFPFASPDIINTSVKTRLVHSGGRHKRRWRLERSESRASGGAPTSTPARTVEGPPPPPVQRSPQASHRGPAYTPTQRRRPGGVHDGDAPPRREPQGSGLLPLVDRRQAPELDEKRRCTGGILAFTLKTRLIGFVLRLTNTLERFSFRVDAHDRRTIRRVRRLPLPPSATSPCPHLSPPPVPSSLARQHNPARPAPTAHHRPPVPALLKHPTHHTPLALRSRIGNGFSSVRNYSSVSPCPISLCARAAVPSCPRLSVGVVHACGARKRAAGPPTRSAEPLALERSDCASSAL